MFSRVIIFLMMVIISAGCSSGDSGNSSSSNTSSNSQANTTESMLVGAWVDNNGDIQQFFDDGYVLAGNVRNMRDQIESGASINWDGTSAVMYEYEVKDGEIFITIEGSGTAVWGVEFQNNGNTLVLSNGGQSTTLSKDTYDYSGLRNASYPNNRYSR